MKASSNALAIARKYRQRFKAINASLERGLKKAAVAVDREQVKLLSGSGNDAPGSYPVPIRGKWAIVDGKRRRRGGKENRKTGGNLRGHHFWDVRNHKYAVVGNAASYAMAIHEGLGSSAKYGRRPFLDDAAEKVDVVETVANELHKGFAI